MVLNKVYKDHKANVDGTVYWKNDKEDINNHMNVQVLEFLVDRRGAMAEQNLQEAIRLRTRLNTPMMRIWHHHLEPFKPMNKMQVLISPPVNDTAIATLLNTMEGSNQTSSLPLTLVNLRYCY